MKTKSQPEREFRIVAAGLFKATCLQLLDEVCEKRDLSIIVTKRGRPVGQLTGSPEGLKISGPTVHVSAQSIDDVPILQAEASTSEERRKKKKHKKNKHK